MEQVSRTSKLQKLDGFTLKLIAIITMTLDHIGLAMESFSNGNDAIYWTAYVFRIIGRLAFPLFAFLLAEGLHHSHNRTKYLLRLGAMWLLLLVAETIINFGLGFRVQEQAFSDLFFFALFIYLIECKKIWVKCLAILPLGFILSSYALNVYANYTVALDPYLYLFGGYSLLGFLVFLGFYYSKRLTAFLFKLHPSFSEEMFEEYKKTSDYELFSNLLGCAIMIVIATLFYVLAYFTSDANGNSLLDAYGMGIQFYMVFSIVLIACYNGCRGYNAKWFQYGCYAYYPLHILLIFGIAALF